MATIKSYTDLGQSKKLAEFLSHESADFHYATWTILEGEFIVSPNQGSTIEDLQEDYGNQIIPCWSLAALLGVLPEPYQMTSNKDGKVQLMLVHHLEKDYYDNPVDACVAMIENLHELKLI